MDITSLPANYKIKNFNCSLTVMNDKYLGWLVTYMYHEYDPLEMDYYPNLQDSIDALCEKLGLKPELITEEWLESNGYHKEILMGKFERWISEDRRIEITKDSNMSGRDWTVHIDNEDFQSIGSLDIQEVWQLDAMLKLTGIKR